MENGGEKYSVFTSNDFTDERGRAWDMLVVMNDKVDIGVHIPGEQHSHIPFLRGDHHHLFFYTQICRIGR